MKNICAPSALFLSLFLAVGIGPAQAEDDRAGSGPEVEMTWMSIANWYFKIGDKRIVITRRLEAHEHSRKTSSHSSLEARGPFRPCGGGV